MTSYFCCLQQAARAARDCCSQPFMISVNCKSIISFYHAECLKVLPEDECLSKVTSRILLTTVRHAASGLQIQLLCFPGNAQLPEWYSRPDHACPLSFEFINCIPLRKGDRVLGLHSLLAVNLASHFLQPCILVFCIKCERTLRNDLLETNILKSYLQTIGSDICVQKSVFQRVVLNKTFEAEVFHVELKTDGAPADPCRGVEYLASAHNISISSKCCQWVFEFVRKKLYVNLMGMNLETLS